MTLERKLKPCPFCLRNAVISSPYFGKLFRIECDNYNCFVKPKTQYCDLKESAFLIWNERKKR